MRSDRSFLAPTIDVLSRNKLRLWLVGVAVAVLGVGVWGFTTQASGVHITECRFDAQGAYAKVRVNNLLAGAHQQELFVKFYVVGSHLDPRAPYEGTIAEVMVPAHGQGTAVV